MKKILITVLLVLVFLTGCQIRKVETETTSDVFRTILFVEDNLSNTFMNGYELYLPKGMTIIDKHDYNLTIKDHKNYYYLYIDTIAYHYQKDNEYQEKNDHLYSEKFSYDGKSGFIDVVENNDKYFIVLMYNYAKVEAIVSQNDFSSALMNICYMLRSVKYNDKVINEYVGENGMLFQEESFNIFDSKQENDNFLKYEEEYGTYKEKTDITKDNDVIDVTEFVE